MRDATGTGSAEAAATAAALLDTLPAVMRVIRSRMREGRPAGVTIAQFRALLYVRRNPRTGLSGVAEHLGTSLPAASELVSRLVAAGLLIREPDPASGRRICLTLSDDGSAELATAQDRTLEWLAARLAALPPERLAVLSGAMAEIRRIVDTPDR